MRLEIGSIFIFATIHHLFTIHECGSKTNALLIRANEPLVDNGFDKNKIKTNEKPNACTSDFPIQRFLCPCIN